MTKIKNYETGTFSDAMFLYFISYVFFSYESAMS